MDSWVIVLVLGLVAAYFVVRLTLRFLTFRPIADTPNSPATTLRSPPVGPAAAGSQRASRSAPAHGRVCGAYERGR
jgi:hypothetical protein